MRWIRIILIAIIVTQVSCNNHLNNQNEMDINNRIGPFLNVSRTISFSQENGSPGAYYLDNPKSETVVFDGQFIGDVERGGCCNVDYLTFCPHSITHLETSAHILSLESNPPMVSDIPSEKLTGIAYLIDLSNRESKGNLISKKEIEQVLEKLGQTISHLMIKTKASLLDENYNFSGKDFLAISPEAANYIHSYSKNNSNINCLILDLPSIDPEHDEGRLMAHRAWFGISKEGKDHVDNIKNALIELAYFNSIPEGYYWVAVSPSKMKTNAVSTGVLIQRISQ